MGIPAPFGGVVGIVGAGMDMPRRDWAGLSEDVGILFRCCHRSSRPGGPPGDDLIIGWSFAPPVQEPVHAEVLGYGDFDD